MTEKEYLLLLKEQAYQVDKSRVVCGFNEDAYGRAVVTTGVLKEYNENQKTCVNQKTMSYEDYTLKQFQQSGRR